MDCPISFPVLLSPHPSLRQTSLPMMLPYSFPIPQLYQLHIFFSTNSSQLQYHQLPSLHKSNTHHHYFHMQQNQMQICLNHRLLIGDITFYHHHFHEEIRYLVIGMLNLREIILLIRIHDGCLVW